jgi:small subunit ribosomal protein S17e
MPTCETYVRAAFQEREVVDGALFSVRCRVSGGRPKHLTGESSNSPVAMTVDPEDVMRIGDDLLEQHAEAFADDFGRNREVVQRLTNVGSIHLRNRIAGYITRRRQSG